MGVSFAYGAARTRSRVGPGWYALDQSTRALSYEGATHLDNPAAQSSAVVPFAFARLRLRTRNILFVPDIATTSLPFKMTLIPPYAMFAKQGWTEAWLPQPAWQRRERLSVDAITAHASVTLASAMTVSSSAMLWGAVTGVEK